MTRNLDDSPRARVLAAAADVFARSGYAGARVDEIAAVAGVNKAMVYYHVGDKSHIYGTVLRDRLDRMLDELHRSVAGKEGAEAKLGAAIAAMTRAAAENPHFAPMMLREIASGGVGLPPAILREASAVFDLFRDILAEGQREGVFRRVDTLSTHMMIAGLVMLLAAGAPIRARMRVGSGIALTRASHQAREHLAESVFDLVINGLRTSGRAPSDHGVSPVKGNME